MVINFLHGLAHSLMCAAVDGLPLMAHRSKRCPYLYATLRPTSFLLFVQPLVYRPLSIYFFLAQNPRSPSFILSVEPVSHCFDYSAHVLLFQPNAEHQAGRHAPAQKRG